jgi:arsenate reductase-like glutaredoxin family protein
MFQIIGNKKCLLTKKALRYCKERNIAHQFVDLNTRDLSVGEWEKIFSSIDSDHLVDPSSRYYKKEGYSWREYNAKEELMSHSELLKTPIIKYKQKAILLETEQDLSKMESIV